MYDINDQKVGIKKYKSRYQKVQKEGRETESLWTGQVTGSAAQWTVI